MTGSREGDGALPGRRRGLLTEFINNRGQATVVELADAFNVSPDTVRRDLDWLAQQGLIARTYGGAITTSGLASTDTAFAERTSVHLGAKRAIGAATAERIADGETVIINGGTTTLAVARALAARRNLTIVTNNLRLPAEVPPNCVRDLYVLGGSCRLSSSVTLGPIAFPGMEGVSADVAVIGVGGVSARTGLTTTNLQEAQMMAQMIDSAQRTIVVADSSKFGRDAFAHIARLEAIAVLVTDQAPDEELSDALREAGADLVTAPPTTGRSRIASA